MAKRRASGHDRGLVDGHCIFGVVGNNGVAGLVVGRDGLILLVDFNALPLRAWQSKEQSKSVFKKHSRLT